MLYFFFFFLQVYLFISLKVHLKVLERTSGRYKSSHNAQLLLVYRNCTWVKSSREGVKAEDRKF